MQLDATHHINIADDSLDNTGFIHNRPFPAIQVKHLMLMWKFFSTVQSILGLTVLHLSVSPILSQIQRNVQLTSHF